MSKSMSGRAVAAVVLLAVEAAMAILAVLLHYGFTAEYGNVADRRSPITLKQAQGVKRNLMTGRIRGTSLVHPHIVVRFGV